MKTVKEPSLTAHTLIYDSACPMCTIYTKAFIKYGYLDRNGRVPYQEVNFEQCPNIQRQDAADKIVLFNRQTGEVSYGIDSLVKVLAAKHRWIGTIYKLKPVSCLFTYLYAFVSYNRKCIAPSPEGTSVTTCQPSVSFPARISFIIITGLLVHLLVSWYFQQFLASFMVANPVPDILLFGAQFIFQWCVFKLLKQQNFYEYSGQLAFVSIIGALLLGVAGSGLMLLWLLGIKVTFLATVVYGMVYLYMFYLHYKRTTLYSWSKWLCVSWMLYRLLIYPLVFSY